MLVRCGRVRGAHANSRHASRIHRTIAHDFACAPDDKPHRRDHRHLFHLLKMLDAADDSMPNITRFSTSRATISSRASSLGPSDSDSDPGSDSEDRSQTSATEPRSMSERPEFLKRMQLSSGVSSRPPLYQSTKRTAETNVSMTAASLATIQSADELARRTGGLTQHGSASLRAAEESTLLHSTNALDAKRQHPIDAARLAYEDALRAVYKRLEKFAIRSSSLEGINRSRNTSRDHSRHPDYSTAIHTSAPVSPGCAVRGPTRPFITLFCTTLDRTRYR